MALVLKDRVKETTTTTGTGTLTLLGAASGFQSFSVIGDGNTTYYTIDGGTEWEVGLGTYTSSGTTLSRDTILESSNGGTAVNFSAGTKNVFVTYPAEKSLYLDASNNAIALGTIAATTTLTNATGLPISTGVSGLGTGVATFLATPSSSNLASAVTDETGSGSLVFATSPTLVTPTLGTPSSGTLTSCTGLPLTTGVTGTLPIANGGTNLTTYTTGDIVYASATNTLGKLADIATGNALISGGVGVAPSYGKIGLTTHVSGTLPVANGGTGQTTANAAFNALAPSQTSNSGKYLTTNGTDTSWATVTQTTFSAGTTGFTPNTATSGTVTLAGTLNVANGGTGTTTAQGAMNTFAGAVTSGSYLRGNGTNVVMSTIQAADVPTLNQNTTGSAATVTGNATGSTFGFNSGYGSVATAYGCRAWVNFDGTSNTANVTGTYSQSGTTVTVTITNHGYITGNTAYLDFTTGTAVDGTYTVTVTGTNTFTVTQASRTTSGNVTARRSTIRASGNVSSIADNGTGDYTVNYTTAMPDANYSYQCIGAWVYDDPNSYVSTVGPKPNNGGVNPVTSSSIRVLCSESTAGINSPRDYLQVSVAIFR